MAVEGGNVIQFSEVVAEADGAVGLWNHNDGAGPGATGRFNDPQL